jgi:hypothetical protein
LFPYASQGSTKRNIVVQAGEHKERPHLKTNQLNLGNILARSES